MAKTPLKSAKLNTLREQSTIDPLDRLATILANPENKTNYDGFQAMGRLFSEWVDRKESNKRREFIRTCMTLFANYDNKFDGKVNDKGEWRDYTSSPYDYNLSIPLFKAHVDTFVAEYSKFKPRYTFKTVRQSDFRYEELRAMVESFATKELDRIFDMVKIQDEAKYVALCGISGRQLSYGVTEESPEVVMLEEGEPETTGLNLNCPSCGYSETVPHSSGMMEEPEVVASSLPVEDDSPVNGEIPELPSDTDNDLYSCPQCYGEMVVGGEVQATRQIARRESIPVVSMQIPNPVSVQFDFNARKGFVAKRSSIPKHRAEYHYGKEFIATADTKRSYEDVVLKDEEGNPAIYGNYELIGAGVDALYSLLAGILPDFDDRYTDLSVKEIWLRPEDYGSIRFDTLELKEAFPDGCYLFMVGDKVVNYRQAEIDMEWIFTVSGSRPSSPIGSGLQHLAEMNKTINKCLSLDYSVLRTSGFPTTIINEQYFSGIIPQANNAFIIKNLKDGDSIQDVITRLPASNTSGMIGAITSRVEGYMPYIGSTWNFPNQATDVSQVMGTATGASAVWEMMSDRLGLDLQRRVHADKETLFRIVEFAQKNESDELRQYLREEYSSEAVDLFFKTNIRAMYRIEPEKGTDTLQLESINIFKIQTFSQLVAQLTGMREFDKTGFYDLVGALGDSLNIPIELGSGRKERHFAKRRIGMVEEMYEKEHPTFASQGLSPDVEADQIFEAIINEEQLIAEDIGVEAFMELYDHESLKETYSDWMQSVRGLQSPLAIRLVIVRLWAKEADIIRIVRDQAMKEQIAMQNAMAIGNKVPSPEEQAMEGELPEGIKRDGTTGVGRPDEVDSAQEVSGKLEGEGSEPTMTLS